MTMHVRRDAMLSIAPVAVLTGIAIALTGLARMVQLVDDAHDVEPEDPR